MKTNKNTSIEFDFNKSRKNETKHGIPLYAGRNVFKDDKRVRKEDTREDYGEIRYVTTGSFWSKLWSVVWTPRGDKARLISARRANRKEKRAYNAA